MTIYMIVFLGFKEAVYLINSYPPHESFVQVEKGPPWERKWPRLGVHKS